MNPRTGDDDIGYRRGLLLGFTISEMVLLLVFILLLTFGFVVLTLNDRLATLDKRFVAESRAKDEVQASLVECGEYAERLSDAFEARDALVSKLAGLDAPKIRDRFDDMFHELELAKRKESRLAAEAAALQEKAARYDRIIKVIHNLRPSTDESASAAVEIVTRADRYDALIAASGQEGTTLTADKIAATAQALVDIRGVLPDDGTSGDLASRIATIMKDRRESSVALANCRSQVSTFGKELGNGADYPPSWTDPVTHKAAFIFDITIGDDGLIVRDTNEPAHDAERAELPIQGVTRGVRIQTAEFIDATRELKVLSDRLNCRHFVRIYLEGQTSSQFKQMLRVEDHFYKLLVRQPTGVAMIGHQANEVSEGE